MLHQRKLSEDQRLSLSREYFFFMRDRRIDLAQVQSTGHERCQLEHFYDLIFFSKIHHHVCMKSCVDNLGFIVQSSKFRFLLT